MTDYPTHVKTRPSADARRRRILQFVVDYSAERGAPPSLREISEETQVSVPCVHGHLAHLAERGFIKRPPRLARAVFVTAAGLEALADAPADAQAVEA